MKNLLLHTILMYLTIYNSSAAQAMSPSELLSEVYSKSLELAAGRAQVESEEAAISAKYSLSNPRLGVMRESNLTAEQRQMGDMQSWVFSQEIMFPTKYFSMGSMQRSKAQAMKEEFLDKKLEIRQKALTQYYNLYASSRIATLLDAQKETLREIARIAESRRATGGVTQQDEMKAHLEQTKIENEILLQDQEITEFDASLKALLNREMSSTLSLSQKELTAPKLTVNREKMMELALQNSKMISAQKAWLGEAEIARSYARMGYLPDFMITYSKPFGSNAPDNAYSLGLEMSIPLWFFAKQNSETSAAAAKNLEAEKRFEQVRRQVEAETKSLSQKSETLAKLLKIYETALIPQSMSTLNSSRSAYSSGRVGFQELLDAERSLYSVRIDYYKNLAKFVETVTMLERTIGTVVSDLPMENQQ